MLFETKYTYLVTVQAQLDGDVLTTYTAVTTPHPLDSIDRVNAALAHITEELRVEMVKQINPERLGQLTVIPVGGFQLLKVETTGDSAKQTEPNELTREAIDTLMNLSATLRANLTLECPDTLLGVHALTVVGDVALQLEDLADKLANR